MTFVCLWIPAGPAGAASGAELAPALLPIAPRIRVAGEVIWADGRGLAARPLAEALLDALRMEEVPAPRAGLSMIPVAAEVAAVHGETHLIEVPAGEERAFLAPYPIA